MGMEHSFTLTPQLIKALKDLDNAYAESYVSLQRSSQEELQALCRYARISRVNRKLVMRPDQATSLLLRTMTSQLSDNLSPIITFGN